MGRFRISVKSADGDPESSPEGVSDSQAPVVKNIIRSSNGLTGFLCICLYGLRTESLSGNLIYALLSSRMRAAFRYTDVSYRSPASCVIVMRSLVLEHIKQVLGKL